MARHVEAERDIEHVDVWDPAFRGWLTEAEECLTAVTKIISHLGGLPVERHEDVVLLQVAAIIDALIGAETEREAVRAHEALADLPAFHCPGRGAVAHRVNRMIASAADRLRDLAGLEVYAPNSDEVPEEILAYNAA